MSLPVVEATPETEGSKWAQAHWIMLGFLVVAIIGWLLSGFYRVEPNEVAIIERLGQYVHSGGEGEGKIDLIAPGPHYTFPWPIDVVHKISTETSHTMVVDEFDSSPTAYLEFKKKLMRIGYESEVLDALYDPYLITADKNVVHLRVSLQHQISDAEGYLTRVYIDPQNERNREKTEEQRHYVYRVLTQHAMIRQLASMKVDEALTTKREELSRGIMVALNEDLKNLGLGVEVRQVLVVSAKPPTVQGVVGAFNDVLVSQQYRENVKKQAETDVNRLVNTAQAEAQQMLLEAQSARNRSISDAGADVDRFKQLYVQYQAAPHTTRWKLYTEAVNSVMENVKRVYTVEKGQRLILTLPSDERN